MLLTSARDVSQNDVGRFSWNGLRRFHNIDYTLDRILKLHAIPKEHRSNAKKQAVQIKQCLVQAEQYFKAASVVGLATKPVLIYYGILSFALAEVLLKQDGGSSLDAARGQHAHHGLDLRKDGNPARKAGLTDSASALKAAPLVRPNGNRFGTFELWHRTQRDCPTVGDVKRHLQTGASTQTQAIIANPRDKRPNVVPVAGLSLLDCMRSIPALFGTLSDEGILPSYARGTILVEVDDRVSGHQFTIIIHPGDKDLIDRVMNGFKFSASMLQNLNITEMPSGVIAKINLSQGADANFELPSTVQYNAEDIFFFTSDRMLNEFGNLYMSMFILGNYARYFPDEWMIDIEENSALALISSELIEIATNRIPLLVLNELTRVVHFIV